MHLISNISHQEFSFIKYLYLKRKQLLIIMSDSDKLEVNSNSHNSFLYKMSYLVH